MMYLVIMFTEHLTCSDIYSAGAGCVFDVLGMLGCYCCHCTCAYTSEVSLSASTEVDNYKHLLLKFYIVHGSWGNYKHILLVCLRSPPNPHVLKGLFAGQKGRV